MPLIMSPSMLPAAVAPARQQAADPLGAAAGALHACVELGHRDGLVPDRRLEVPHALVHPARLLATQLGHPAAGPTLGLQQAVGGRRRTRPRPATARAGTAFSCFRTTTTRPVRAEAWRRRRFRGKRRPSRDSPRPDQQAARPADPVRRGVGRHPPRREGGPGRAQRRRQVHHLPHDHEGGVARRRPGLDRSRRDHRLLQPGRGRDGRAPGGGRGDGRRRRRVRGGRRAEAAGGGAGRSRRAPTRWTRCSSASARCRRASTSWAATRWRRGRARSWPAWASRRR